MKINNTTIENYTTSIANQKTRKNNKYLLTKFVRSLENNEITDVNQENINMIFRDYQTYLNQQKIKASTRNQHLIILKNIPQRVHKHQIRQKTKTGKNK